MTAYTVVLLTAAPQPPTQQPGTRPALTQGNGNPSQAHANPTGLTPYVQEDRIYSINVQNVSAADKPSAQAAAITAYQNAWATQQNALFAGTQNQVLEPGEVPTYTAADAPLVRLALVLTGTATNP